MIRITILVLTLQLFLLACTVGSHQPAYIISEEFCSEQLKQSQGLPAREGARYSYGVAAAPWQEELGNHRAVLGVTSDQSVAALDFEWRRHDRDPQRKNFVIINASTGERVKNIRRYAVSQERVQIAFGPVEKGSYYFYYLPYKVQTGYGFYTLGYTRPEHAAGSRWRSRLPKQFSTLNTGEYRVEVEQVQARTEFDSFFPMEVTASATEKCTLLGNFDSPYLVFPESREFPIRMMDEIPTRWIDRGPGNAFAGSLQNEYFVFQAGLYALHDDIDNVTVQFKDLVSHSSSAVIPAASFTSFNTEGIDPWGKPFKKDIDVAQGAVQPLWIGIDIAADQQPGLYEGHLWITTQSGGRQRLDIELVVEDEFLADRGDSELWRHSRLRWLNSTAGIDNQVVAPFLPVTMESDRSYQILGRNILLGEDLLPGRILAGETSILSHPVSFEITGSDKPVNNGLFVERKGESYPGKVVRSAAMSNELMEVSTRTSLESDGYLRVSIDVSPRQDFRADNVSLNFPLNKAVAKYMMGMGLPGTEVPQKHRGKWGKPQDSFWVGNAQGGLWVELRGGEYHGPLLNSYRPDPPPSWHNQGKGGFSIETSSDSVLARAYSGAREFRKGENVRFEFAMLVTPVKPLKPKSQFEDRYYHNGGKPLPSDSELSTGVKIVNVHHANEYNAYINYPYLTPDKLGGLVDELHGKGVKVKIYNTVRELTNHTVELWALRSMGDEIFDTDGDGGGYPWLREHLVDHYVPQWYQHFPETGTADASIRTAPGSSRWYNYYIEGLGWLVRELGIDGLYLDDVAYDRDILKRMRKVLIANNPGAIMDLHSNTGFSKGPAIQYAEYYPYIDKLWFGESFNYNKMSAANYLVEVSGIPFGLMGDMLHGGGNRWLGMVFGMTVRLPWTTEGVKSDPRPIWQLWDDFGIEDSRMSGFWDEDPLVTTSSEVVKATAYQKDDAILVAFGNFSDKTQRVEFKLDEQKTGWRAEVAEQPYIKDFQDKGTVDLGSPLTIPARKGIILILTPGERQ